jgi:DNA-binding transcriptional MerR regulator
VTRDLLSALTEDLSTAEVQEALQASDGLCLPHLRLALGSTNDDPGYETLLRIQQAKLERLKHELAEFIRKNDYQAIKEGFGSEGDAWLRAIAMVVGGRIER